MSTVTDTEDNDLDDDQGTKLFCPFCMSEPDEASLVNDTLCNHCAEVLSLTQAKTAATVKQIEDPKILLLGTGLNPQANFDYTWAGASYWLGLIEENDDSQSEFHYPKAMVALCINRAWEEF